MIDPSPQSTIDAVRRRIVSTPLWDEVANADAVIDAAIAIQQIPAPTFHEEQPARAVADQMRDLGLHEVRLDALHNVYGCLRGRDAGPGVLISAHTDTVFGHDADLAVRRDGTRLYGPGLGDNSISVAALLHLARVIQHAAVPLDRTLWFVANTGEEGLGDLRGMRAVVDQLRSEIDQVIVLDAQFGSIVHGGVASRRFRISVQAAGGHSWQDFGAPSAVHVLVRLAARLTDLSVAHAPKSTFNIGVIEGGTTVNALAQHASLLLDLRSVDPALLADLIEHVAAIVGDAATAHPDVTIDIETVGDRPGGSIDRQHPLVQLAHAAYAAVDAHVSFDVASTDANVPLSEGIAAVCVGMCVAGNAHRLDEYIETNAIGAGMRAMLLLLLGAAHTRGNG